MKYKNYEINQTCANTYQCYAWDVNHWHAVGEEHASVAAAKRWINEEEEERKWLLKPTPKKAGRPPTLTAATRHSVNLTPDHIATAKRLGNGNISAGIRLALDKTK